MKTKTERILAFMNFLAWIGFFALLLKAGSILTSFIISIAKPEGTKNIYLGLNLYSLRKFDFWHYTGSVALMAAITAMEAYVALLVIRVLSKIKMASPFTIEIARRLERISIMILFIWAVSMLYNAHAEWLMKSVIGLQEPLIEGDFIYLAGIVFIFSQIFKKGVELQSENELTV